MKTTVKTARSGSPTATPGRPAAPPRRPRSPRPRPTAPALHFRTPEQRQWFDAEVAAASRLVHTARLAGDFVAAQRLEGELNSFTELTRRLLGAEAGCEVTYDEQGEQDETVCSANTDTLVRTT